MDGRTQSSGREVAADSVPGSGHEGPLASASMPEDGGGVGDDAFLGARIRLLYANAPIQIAATLIVGFTLVASLWNEVDRPAVVSWYGAMVLVSTARTVFVWRFGRESEPRDHLWWAWAYTLGAVTNGLIWGLGIFLLDAGYASFSGQLFLFMLAGMTAGAATASYSFLPAALGFILPALVPMTVDHLLSGRPGHVIMGGVLIVYMTFIARLAANGQSALIERRRAEISQRDSERQWQVIMEAVPFPLILLAHPDMCIIYANEAACRTLGFNADELTGRAIFDLRRERADAGEILIQLSQKGVVRDVEREFLRKDGASVPAVVSAKIIPLHGKRAVLLGFHDVHMLKEGQRELRMAMERAEAANRTKTEFLANMSHELRTPLNAIIGFSEVMIAEIAGPLGSPRYAEYMSDIRDSGRKLLVLINDLLDLSRIEVGRLALDETEIDLVEIAGASLKMAEERARARQVALATEFEPDLPLLIADGGRIRQIVDQLLSNAVKFTPAGGRVVLRISRSDEGPVVLSVRDTGVGIAPHDLDRVAEPFAMLEGSLSREGQGSGLGLSLSKSLAELHGGTLEIESETGVGTEVTFRIPAARVTGRFMPVVGAAKGA